MHAREREDLTLHGERGAERRPGVTLASCTRGSATAEVGTAAAAVARRAGDAVRNDPHASRIVDLWIGNAVGAGITTRSPDTRHALSA